MKFKWNNFVIVAFNNCSLRFSSETAIAKTLSQGLWVHGGRTVSGEGGDLPLTLVIALARVLSFALGLSRIPVLSLLH